MRKRRYSWYVEPINAYTNMSISMQLPEENFGQFACEDGEYHNLWKCSYKEVKSFWESKKDIGLELNIYNQEGNGSIRLCNFLFSRKKKKRQAKAAN